MTEKKRGRPPMGTEVVNVRLTKEVADFLRDVGNGDASVGAAIMLSQAHEAQTTAIQNLTDASDNIHETLNVLLRSVGQMQSQQDTFFKALTNVLTSPSKGNA